MVKVSLIKVTQLTRVVMISPLVKVIRGRTINLPNRAIKTKTLSPPNKVIRISLAQIRAASLGIMYKLV